MTKHCNRCGTETERAADGKCKECKKARSAAYRLANIEKELARNKKYKALNIDKVRASTAAWRAANHDRVRKNKLAWRTANREKVLKIRAAYRVIHSAKAQASTAAWKLANPDICAQHRRNRRAMKASARGTHTQADIQMLFTLQRGKCACCKTRINNWRHVDHVIPLARGGSNDRLNLQLLCPTCNMQKHAKHPIDFMQERGFLL